jgi:signal transduction histidine kinase
MGEGEIHRTDQPPTLLPGPAARSMAHLSRQPVRHTVETSGDTLTRSARPLINRAARAASAVGLERGARLIAVAAAPLLMSDHTDVRWNLVFAGLASYVMLTALVRRTPLLRAADIAVAAAVIVLSGGDVTPFVLFLAVAVAGPAARGGMPAGLAAGVVLSTVLLASLAVAGTLGEFGLTELIRTVLLLPLVGLMTAYAVRILDERESRLRRMLEEANSLLSSLREIADHLPGGLDATTIAAAAVAEIRAVEGAEAAIVFVEENGTLQSAGSAGIDASRLSGLRVDEVRIPGARRARGRRPFAPSELPVAVRGACEPLPAWVVLLLGGGDDPAGALMVGFGDAAMAARALPRLESVAEDAALAFENARLFDGTLLRAADVARKRIAGDLHDGVAQSLTHLRMELELMAMASDDSETHELGRLARVAEVALDDLRTTIDGLRRPVDGDIEVLLRRHLNDVRPADGPQVVLETRGSALVDFAITEEVLRVAQEAVSNALRHAAATTITVTLERDDISLALTVEDDGIGLRGSGRAARTIGPATSSRVIGSGVGLRSMRDRAQRLRGELEIRPRADGGTVVALRCPLGEWRSPSRSRVGVR